MDHRITSLIVGLGFGAALSIPIYAEPPLPVETVAIEYCKTDTAEPTIGGTAAYVYDIEGDTVLYEKNGLAQLPLASLAKVMTVFTSLETLGQDGVVTMTDDAFTPEGDWGFVKGEEWKAGDLAAYTLIESANDGARALLLAAADKLHMSEADFIEAMNRRARGLDLHQTYFINETGLDVSASTAGAYGSARDIAHLVSYVALFAPDRIERSALPGGTFTSLSGRAHKAENTTLLAASYGAAMGSKTGYTDLAGGNLAFIYEPIPGRPVALVVLGSTREGRVDDVRALAAFAEEKLHKSLQCASL
jgi:serine-type D-Ala-D-Ala carboxypeptidase (penicillin-binding protein 5/6)